MVKYLLLFTFSTMLFSQEVELNKSLIQSYLAEVETAGVPILACNVNEVELLKTAAEYECDCDTVQDKVKPSEIDLNKYKLWSNPLKLKTVTFGGGQFNDSNMFVKAPDDLGMTASFDIGANFSFADKYNSKTDIYLLNQSSLHSQFLGSNQVYLGDDNFESKYDYDNDGNYELIDQSILSVNSFMIGAKNNTFLIKNPNISIGAMLGVKTINTDPNSSWGQFQGNRHHNNELRTYSNQSNPFMTNESYITPMATIDFEKASIYKAHCYLKSEASIAAGPVIPLQSRSLLYTPIQANIKAAMAVGYAPKQHPLIYLRAEANLSNESLPYERDNATIGIVGVAIGNEIPLIRRDKIKVLLLMETKIAKPFGNNNFSNSLPNQSGKQDILHKAIDVKLRFVF
jgi:hypothetical protein